MRWWKFLCQVLFGSRVATPAPYAAANNHLAQGDIFSLRLVTPLADNEIRILRTESGRHGDYAFSGEPGRIFDHDDLLKTLADLPPDDRLLPFSSQGGIPLEYVVVFGDLVEYFMVASQTCDVSGVDSTPKPYAAILPIISLASYLSRHRLPIGLAEEEAADESKWTTVVGFLEVALGENLDGVRDDPFALPDQVRKLLREWSPPKKDTKSRQIRNRILDMLSKVIDPNKKYLYYLPADRKQGVPEGYVDFTRLYSVLTGKLNDLAGSRACTLDSPYREDFSNKLGAYLSRIATPAPLTPPKL